ncbi:hypothetical protein HR060_10760 [Catenovulum sp. SM1970]|uniref:hypothetical protein n=1 Tax=Marinifaba aquimaris TaxID=2741323 RepID=UPI001572286E|nr:hypothetical protein [Marinifaba aquimaris]NTS77345.1 hypothetical protein [Marinifaba aquimaris]
MKYYAQIKNGVVVGVYSASNEVVSDDVIEIANDDLSLIGQLYDSENGFFTTVDREKASMLEVIKQQAKQRIESLAWKVERANERIALNIAGANAELLAVYAEREAIRQASNKAESDLNKKRSVNTVRAFTW